MLKIYTVRWSDDGQKWGKPNWCSRGNSELGMPFGYFLAEDDRKAEEFTKTLPPLIAVSKKGYYPENFYLGSFWPVWKPE